MNATPIQPTSSTSSAASGVPFGAEPDGAERRYRSIFISDIHLGTRGCQAEMLLDFLRHTESEKLYLVGDIVDGWVLKRKWFWPQLHNDVVQKLLRKARKGTEVIYIPGNHDEGLREYLGLEFGAIKIENEAIFETADGRKFLVLHGDQFDMVCQNIKWLAVIGDYAYRFALALNTAFNWVRRRFGFGYFSLSGYLKHKVKNAVEYVGRYEQAVAEAARLRGVDGVICGHIHKAEMRDMGGVLYLNDGDWVESCTALVEHEDGALEILRWSDIVAERERERLAALPQAA